MKRNKGYTKEWFSWKCMAIGKMESHQRSKASWRKWVGKNTAETKDMQGQRLSWSSGRDLRSQTFTRSSRIPTLRMPLRLSIKLPRVQLQPQSSLALQPSRGFDRVKRGFKWSVAWTIFLMLVICAWKINCIEFWRSREPCTVTRIISHHWPSFSQMITPNSLMCLQKGS